MISVPSSLGIVNASNHDFSPEDLKPYLWLDATDESTLALNATTGPYIDGGLVSTTNATTGINSYALMTGNTRVVISDIDIVVKVKLANWNAASQFLLSYSSNAYMWHAHTFYIDGGFIKYDTTLTISNYSVAIPSWSANSTRWVRVRRNESTGTVTFYFSDNGSSWTQIGSPQAGTAGAINGNAFGSFYIGQVFGFYQSFAGTIYSMQVYQGDLSSGQKIVDIDFENAPRHARSLRDTAGGGTVSLVSHTNGRAVTAISPKYRQYRAAAAEIINGDGLRLPGTSGNYAFSLDSAALDIAGDIDVAVRMSMNDWTPSTTTFIGKYAVSDESFYIQITSTGGMTFAWRAGGSPSVATVSSTANLGFVDGTTNWVRVTVDVDNGAGQSETKFWYAADSSEYPSSWTQLGTTRLGSITSIRVGTAPLLIGTDTFGFINGTIKRAVIKSGISGTTVFDADFTAQASATAQFIESSANQAVVTVASTATFAQGTLASMPALGNDPRTGKVGLYFNGAQHLAGQVISDWKLLNDGTQFIVAIVLRLTEANPDSVRVPMATLLAWEATTVGWWIGYDDRSGIATNDSIVSNICNGTAMITNLQSANNTFPTLETHVVTTAFKPLAAAGATKGSITVNTRQMATDTTTAGAPANTNPYAALQIGRIPQQYTFTGTIHEIVIVSGDKANETARKQLNDYLIKKYRIGRDRDADWLNGTYTSTATHHVVTFRQSGSFTPLRNLNVEYLVVGGGGAGAQGDAAGGGGAGGAIASSMTMNPRMYAVEVGAGATTTSPRGQNSFLGDREIIAYGGGGGAANSSAGQDGGSGGGASGSFTFGSGIAGQGYSGGTAGSAGAGGGGGGGGAGGAGGNGSNASQTAAGNGGLGIEWPIGSGVYYASGGGGGGSAGGTGSITTSIIPGGGGRGSTGTTAPESGTANTGGGGGGSRNAGAGSGGSGIVIIRWPKTS